MRHPFIATKSSFDRRQRAARLKVPAFAKSWRQGCTTFKRMQDLKQRRSRGSMSLPIATLPQIPIADGVRRAFPFPALPRLRGRVGRGGAAGTDVCAGFTLIEVVVA